MFSSFTRTLSSTLQSTREQLASKAEQLKTSAEKLLMQSDGDRAAENKRKLESGDAYPPWMVFEEDKCILQDELQKRLLAITAAADAEKEFFDLYESGLPIGTPTCTPFCVEALNQDKHLQTLRFKLVPRSLTEEQFWQTYFYSVEEERKELGVAPLKYPEHFVALVETDDADEEAQSDQKDQKGSVEREMTPQPARSHHTQNDSFEDFTSEDLVSTGMQDEDLMASMREELGITDEPVSVNHDDDDFSMDELESMLQDEANQSANNTGDVDLSDKAFEDELNASFQELGLDLDDSNPS